MLLIAALLSPALASDDVAVTFSYRAIVGLSARVEVATSPMLSPFGEVGLSGWVVPGDDPTTEQGSVLIARPHAKVGLDVGPAEGGWYAGPRLVVATNRSWGGVSNLEAGVLGTVGYKVIGPRGGRTQVGLGAGLHAMRTIEADPEVAVFPLPHVELRFGW